MSRAADALTGFAGIVGAGNVLTDRAELARFEADGRAASGRALAVVRPGSTGEVSAVVRQAARHGIRLVPQGGRTGLVGAGLADESGEVVLLSLERIARPPVIDPLNRTAQVDAGVLLSSLNEAAGAHGLFFPIDLGADPSIGGMIAANTGGARFLRYGDVRRNVLGLQMVVSDGEGSVIEHGASTWKNNIRLDLKQLFVGSSGSLGIVTGATLALQPKPATAVSAMLALSDPEAAIALLIALEAAFGMVLSAFEGMSDTALAAAFAHVPRLRDPFAAGLPPYAVLVELSAGAAFDAELLEEQLELALAPWFENGTLVDAAVDRRGDLWAIRHAIPEGLRASGRVVACDVAVRRGDVMGFRRDLAARVTAVAPMLVVHDFGHIGDGGLHFNMVWPTDAGPFAPDIVQAARETVFHAVVEDYGGSFSAEHGIGPSNAAQYDRLVPLPNRRLAGAVQRAASPVPIGRVDFGQ